MPAKPANIDDFLVGLSADKRSALSKLRKAIHAAASKAEECISYGLPAFRLDGRLLCCFGASTKHCSFFPGSGTAVETLKDELKGYDTSKGTIRFAPNKPLPATLVRKVIMTRIAENAARGGRVAKLARPKAKAGAVDAFMATLKHPNKAAIEAMRQIILNADRSITEGIKWNSPSFRTSDFFATMNLRAGRVWLILHTGAKAKGFVMQGKIADEDGLLKWLAKDRCLATFDDTKSVVSKRKALTAIVRAWIERL